MFLIPTGEVRKCDDLTRDEFSFRVRGKTPLDSSENDSLRLNYAFKMGSGSRA